MCEGVSAVWLAGVAPAGEGPGTTATAPGVPGGDVAGELSGGPEPAPVIAAAVSGERLAPSAKPTLERTTMTRRTISNNSTAVAPEAPKYRARPGSRPCLAGSVGGGALVKINQ